MPNAALAYAVLDHIDAHPETWNQKYWLIRTGCGTTATLTDYSTAATKGTI